MKRPFLYLFSMFFLGMLLLSCQKDVAAGGDNDIENDSDLDDEFNPEQVYCSVLYDEKYLLSEFVDLVFANMAESAQTETFKNMYVSLLTNMENQIKTQTGVQNIKLGFRKVAYSYNSVDVEMLPIELSSVALWRGYYMNDTVWCDIAPKDICLVEHFTIAANHECPNVGFPIELLITGNSLTLMPDYIGYGITHDVFHPYLNHELCAQNSIDALPAGYQIFDALSSEDIEAGWKLCVIGASQGGGNALAVHKYMDTHDEFADMWNFEYSYAAAGPHNPSLTMRRFFEMGKTTNPIVLSFTLKSMFDSYPEIMGKYEEDMMYSENYLQFKDEIDNMLISKNFTTSEINSVICENVKVTIDDNLADDEIYLADIFSDDMFDEDSEIVKDLYKCLDKNDLTKDWTPKRKIKLFFGKGDRVVPYENSVAVYDAFGSAKVSYIEADETVDHQMICTAWMIKILTEGI